MSTRARGRAFQFDDCAVGNLVFAGAFVRAGRSFNEAVDDYAALVGLPRRASSRTSPTGRTRFWSRIDATGACSAAKQRSSTRRSGTRSRTSSSSPRPLDARMRGS